MIYAEASFYDGAHFQHIADREEHLRLTRIRKAVERRSIPRVSMPVDVTDEAAFPEIAAAVQHARQLRMV